ncbi:MAG: FAD-dependent oxidoreductase [Chitinophagaceae bacterium]
MAENKITIYRDEWLDRSKGGVTKIRYSITSIKTLSGARYHAKMFIGATYEGDLMAAAGISCPVGCEADLQYNEKWNGGDHEGS